MNKLTLFILTFLTSYTIQAQYVCLEDGKFKLNNQDYYLMVLNYSVNIRKNSQNEYWISPEHSYGNTNGYECNNKLCCLEELRAHFQMIKDMGFNTIRLCGISPEYNSDYKSNKTGLIYMNSSDANINPWLTTQDEITPSIRSKMFSFISDILNIAGDRNLKVILLCGGPDSAFYRDKYADYLEALATNFKNNTTLLGYDLFNEPSYFSKMKREGLSKSQICGVVSEWICRMKTADPNHLITVGFTNSSAIGDWDPELIPVDFASFHPYGSTNQVVNEIYWYAKNMTKPWIIGETGLPADNDQISYEEQRLFASTVLKRCRDCGSNGFSWWSYQDVWWGSGINDYFGLLSHTGTTATSVSGLSVQGTPKPAVNEFKNFSAYIPSYNCPVYANYYNSSPYHITKVSGKIINNSNNTAIEGAVAYGRDINWNIISTTFSHLDGSFELYTDSDNPIRIIDYGYLKMDNGVTYLSAIDNSNPTNLNDVTINIGQSRTYNSQNSVTTSNFIIKGDRSNGGVVIINAPLYIKFSSGNKVEKGGRLNASSNRVLTSPLRLVPLSNCASPLKGANINEGSIISTASHDEVHNFTVYPNPSNGFLNIKSNNTEHKTIELFDIFGKLVISKSTDDELTSLDISILSSGIYMLKINTNKGFELKKIIRQ